MTKFKLLATAFAVAASALATPALAQATNQGTVEIQGSVAERCLFTTPSATIDLDELALGGTDTNAGKLDASQVNGRSETLVGWCNATASTMTVQASPLLNVDFTSTPPSGFDRRVDFTATATANSVDATDSSTTPLAGTPQTVNIFTGDVVVELSAAATPGGGLLVAGDYEGEVTVTLSPAV